MNEIEKMYENAEVKPQYKKRIECKDGYKIGYPCDKGIACINCNRSVFEDVMSPFTVEKQLEIENILLQKKNNYMKWINYSINTQGKWVIGFFEICKHEVVAIEKTREEAFASLVNQLWQDLTEEEKQQIKEILK